MRNEAVSATETEPAPRIPLVDVSPSVVSSPRGLLALAGAVLVITLVQVLLNPISFLLGGYEAWPFALPVPATIAIIVVACALQSGALLLSAWRPPLATLAALACYLGAVYVIGAPNWAAPMQLGVAAALFLVAARRSLRTTALTFTASLAVQAGALTLWAIVPGQVPPALTAGFLVGAIAAFAAPLLGGAALGVWWRLQSTRVELARATAEAERRENAARIAQAREAERARVAQELHDVAGQHIMGLISLADAAAEVQNDSPDEAESLLEDVRREAQFAAASLYAALRELRSTPDSVAAATPDATRIEELAKFWQRRDVDVQLSIRGHLDELPAVVSTTMYRVVLEGLTNAAKHAPGAPVRVSVEVDEENARIEVVNGVPNRALVTHSGTAGLGWGIESISARTRLLDGSFDIGPTRLGGWQVSVSIPLTRVTDAARAREAYGYGSRGAT